MEPRLALDEAIQVDSEGSSSEGEDESTDECVRQALAASRRDTEEQAQLVGQTAGAGASGAQATLPEDHLVRLDTPGMLALLGSASRSPPSPGVPSAKRSREEDGGEEEGSEREKRARREEAPEAETVANDPQAVETGPAMEAEVAPVTPNPDVTGPAAEETTQE